MQTGNRPFVAALGAHSHRHDNLRSFPRSKLRVGDPYDPIVNDRDLDRNAANFQPLTSSGRRKCSPIAWRSPMDAARLRHALERSSPPRQRSAASSDVTL
jgi:hypothetical protein